MRAPMKGCHATQAGGCWPACVGTSSFSMSGVNAHAVLECRPNDGSAASPMPVLWRRKAFGMPWPVPSGHPLLYTAAAVRHGSAEGLARFSMRLDRPCVAFLGDHTVHGAALLPAAAMCEAASAAAAALLRSTSRRVAVLAATIGAPFRLPPSSSGEDGTHAEAHLDVDVRAGGCKLASAGANLTPSQLQCQVRGSQFPSGMTTPLYRLQKHDAALACSAGELPSGGAMCLMRGRWPTLARQQRQAAAGNSQQPAAIRISPGTSAGSWHRVSHRADPSVCCSRSLQQSCRPTGRHGERVQHASRHHRCMPAARHRPARAGPSARTGGDMGARQHGGAQY